MMIGLSQLLLLCVIKSGYPIRMILYSSATVRCRTVRVMLLALAYTIPESLIGFSVC